MTRDFAGGLALAIFAALYLWGAGHIPHSSLSDEVGARGMPLALGALLLLVAGAIMARAWLARARASDVTDEKEDDGGLARVLGMLACAALYILIGWLAGYVIATFVAILAVSIYEGAPVNGRTLAVAAAGAAFFWLLFVQVLAVAQPVGLLFGG